MQTFRHVELLEEPYRYWKQGDQYLQQLDRLAQEIEQRHTVGSVSAEEVITWKRGSSRSTPASTRHPAVQRLAGPQLPADGGVAAVHYLMLGVALILVALWHTRRMRSSASRCKTTC